MTRRVLGKEKVREGKAKIPLTIEEPDYANGEYPLNIKYLENDYYEGSDAFGKLLHVFKTFIHCPTIYVYKGIDEFAKLTVNLYSNNNLLNEGEGRFIVEKLSLDNNSSIINGSAYYDYNLKKYENNNQSFFPYGFNYFGVDENYREPVKYENAKVIFVELGRNLIPVSIKTYPVMGAKGDTVKLIARVYKTINGGAIDPPKDIPDNGYLKWYVNERYIGQTEFYESGYSMINYTIIEEVGVYEYKVEYIPTNTTHYNKGYGANTLCVLPQSPQIINAQANIPTSQLGETCSFTINLSSTECINGLRLYIDDQIVPLTGTNSNNNYTKNVTSKNVEVSFNIPPTTSSSKRWAVEGTHMVFWEYTDTCNGITHYQQLNILNIMFPSNIDFDYIGRNTETPYNQIIYNTKKGIPIVTPEILGHIYNTKYPQKSIDDGTLTLDIEKLVTHLSQSIQVEHVAPTVNASHYEVDDNANIQSILYSNKDLPIPSRSLKFIITNPENSSNTISKTTTISGATNKILLNIAGTWEIQTKYTGNKYEYDSASSTKSITVYKKDTTLTLSNTPTTIYVDDTVTYTSLLTCNATPLQNLPIILQIDNQNTTKTTNTEGKVTLTKKYTQAGTSTIKADFNETYKYKTVTTTKTVTIKKLPTTITAEDQTGKLRETFTVPITIKDKNNNNVTSGNITIKDGNTTIKTINIATDTLSFSTKLSEVGTKQYKIIYEDTENRYNNIESTVNITAESSDVIITHNKNSVNAYDTGINDSDNFNFILKDEKGNPVTKGNLEIFLQPTYYAYVDIVQPISVKNITVNETGILSLNALNLITSSLKSFFRNNNYNYYLRYNVTVKYTDSTGTYNTCTTMNNELYVWYLVKEPILELKVWSKQPSSNDYSLVRQNSITEFGENGDVSNNTPLNVPANADIKVQFRVLDTAGNNIGGVGYHKWITHEHDIPIYVQDEETGEFKLTEYGNKIPHTTAKRTIKVEQAQIDPITGEEIIDPITGEKIMEIVDVETPILMNPCYAGIPLPEPTLLYTEDPFEITSYNQNNVITFRLPEEVHGESTMFIGLTYYALGIFGMYSNTVLYPNESFMGGLDDETHEYNDPKTHRYGVIMNIKFNSP